MQLELWKILLLAVIQGIAEFLPVSSSGHIVVLSRLLANDPDSLDVASLNIALHLGTLGSILVYYWNRVWALLKEDRKIILYMIIGTIPAVLVVLVFKFAFKVLDTWLESPLVAGIMFPVTGIVLLLSGRSQGNEDYRNLTASKAWWIGVAQACAILPGLSRSGSTIAAGLANRLSRSSAATFAFLLAIPAIAGAGVLDSRKLLSGDTSGAAPLHLLIGAFVSFVVGLVSLWALVRILEQGRIKYFAYYCILLGVVVIVWRLGFAT